MNTNENVLKTENMELKKKIEDLEKRLNDRNPAFNKNLLSRVDSEFEKMREVIGKSIAAVVDKRLLRKFEHKPMRIYLETNSYSDPKWKISFEDKDGKEIKNELANIELRNFQESLDNFSWAVSQQVGQ